MRNRMDEEQDVENVGIMQGFMDSMNEQEDEDEEEGDEEGQYSAMDRRPDSPEILMNNLRGDMRSIDARRDELADLVGYAAASETPEPVLAMLQPVLAGQGPGAAGGIGALPSSQAMAQGPQPPMMPPAAPPMAPGAPGAEMAPPPGDGGIAALLAGAGAGGPPPGAPQPPVQMARGGYVQHFQAGSNEAGVTPVESETESSGDLSMYPPDLVAAARNYSANLLTMQPKTVPSLKSLMEKRLPEYKALIGDKGAEQAEAEMLFGLAQRAFNFAANTDDSGRPLRGGFGARLAGAVKTLPAAIGKSVEAMNAIDLKLKTLAMQASEKDQEELVKENTELLKRKGALYSTILSAQAKIDAKKAGAGTSIFGKGDWDYNVFNMPGMMDRYSAGQTNPDETRLVDSALTKFLTPTYETRYDPVTREPYTFQRIPTLPGFVQQAVAARKAGGFSAAATPAITPSGVNVRLENPPTQGGQGAGPGQAGAPAPAGTPPKPGTTGQLTAPSLWNDRFRISGPVAASIAAVSAIPGLGDPAADITLARKQAEQQAERVVDALLKSVAGSVKEQERIGRVINIKPSTFRDPDAYGTGLIALGSTIQDMIREYDEQGAERSGLKPEDKGLARRKSAEFRRIYGMLGLPPAVYSVDEFKNYPPGTEVLWNGRTPARVK